MPRFRAQNTGDRPEVTRLSSIPSQLSSHSSLQTPGSSHRRQPSPLAGVSNGRCRAKQYTSPSSASRTATRLTWLVLPTRRTRSGVAFGSSRWGRCWRSRAQLPGLSSATLFNFWRRCCGGSGLLTEALKLADLAESGATSTLEPKSRSTPTPDLRGGWEIPARCLGFKLLGAEVTPKRGEQRSQPAANARASPGFGARPGRVLRSSGEDFST